MNPHHRLEPGTDPGAAAPLSPQVFQILLSLADRPRHGYGILLEVEERTAGRVVLGTGTLYSVIKRLRQQGWIEESDPPTERNEDPRRKHYRLTPVGRQAMVLEAERLLALVQQAEFKSILPARA